MSNSGEDTDRRHVHTLSQTTHLSDSSQTTPKDNAAEETPDRPATMQRDRHSHIAHSQQKLSESHKELRGSYIKRGYE